MKKTWLILLISIITLASCTTSEEERGSGSISGKVYMVQHNSDNYTFDCDTTIAAKEDVFIVYGDNTYFDDDCETGSDGTYQFKFLGAGDYTIFAYSETNTGEKIAEKKTITLKNREDAVVDNIYIHSGKNYGTAMTRGKVRAQYFDKDGNVVDNDWAYDHRVYIQRLNDNYYFDNTRVGIEGYYYFNNLQPDTYVIYTFSEDMETQVPTPVYDTITIAQPNTIVDGKTLNIYIKA